MRMRSRRQVQPRRNLAFTCMANVMKADDSTLLSITDAQGKILHVNDLYCRVSGFERKELIGNSHRLVQSGVHDGPFYQQLWNSINQDQVWRGIIENRTKSGDTFWVHTVIIPVKDKHLQEKQFLCMQHDVTAEIRKESRRLEASNRKEIEQLLGSVIHEIGNPLTTVKGFLQQYNSSVMFQKSEVGLLLGELGQIENTLKSLHELAKIYQNRRSGIVDMSSLICESVGQLKREYAEMRIGLAVSSKEELTVWGVSGQIKQLVDALLREAAASSRGEEALEISLMAEEGPWICLRLCRSRKRDEDEGNAAKEADEDVSEDVYANWRRIIQKQIMEQHQIQFCKPQMEGGVTEVRFPRFPR